MRRASYVIVGFLAFVVCGFGIPGPQGAGLKNFTQTAAADSTAPTHINLPTGGTAAQAGWLAVEVNGATAWIPYWQ